MKPSLSLVLALIWLVWFVPATSADTRSVLERAQALVMKAVKGEAPQAANGLAEVESLLIGALKDQPQDRELLSTRAQVWLLTGHYRAALDDFEQLRAAGHEWPELLMSRCLLQERLGLSPGGEKACYQLVVDSIWPRKI